MAIINKISKIDFIKEINIQENPSLPNPSILVCDSVLTKQYWLNLFIDNIAKQSNQNQTTFSSLNIQTWHSWTNQIWQNNCRFSSLIQAKLLNANHREHLFADILNTIIHKHKKTHHFTKSNLNAICKNLITSWQFLNDYNIPYHSLSNNGSMDHILFCELCEHYRKMLDTNNWVDPSQLESAIIALLEQSTTIHQNTAIYFSGLTHLTPKQMALIESLSHYGYAFFSVENETKGLLPKSDNTPIIHQRHFENSDDEIYALVKHLKALQLKNEFSVMAVFVANLFSLENDINRIFTQAFDNIDKKANNNNPICWHFHSPKFIITLPAIDILITLFDCCKATFDYASFSKILLSPYLFQTGNRDNFEYRHFIDKSLREVLQQKVSLKQILYALNKLYQNDDNSNDTKTINHENNKRYFLSLIKRLTEFSQNVETVTHIGFNSYNKAGAWFSEQLTLLQWIGYFDFSQIDIKDDDIQSQQLYSALVNSSDSLHYLHECLDNLSALNLVLESLEAKRKTIDLQMLQQRLLTQFNQMPIKRSAESALANVQFFDMDSSDALIFDNIWLMNLNDKDWPPAKKYYPFIPYHIVNEVQCIQTDSRRLYDYALALTQSRIASAKTVEISSSKRVNDRECLPSNILYSLSDKFTTIDIIDNETAIDLSEIASTESSQPHWQIYTSETVSPLDAVSDNSEIVEIPGGADAIKNQIACPFRAWVKNRLSLNPLNSNEMALHPKLHGISIHHLLERFWLKVKSHDNLSKLYETDKIDETIDEVIRHYFSQNNEQVSAYDNFNEVYPPLLSQLIKEWLNFELTRPSFEVVEQESKQNFVINKASFRFKPDRVDKIGDDDFLIIDYKSGTTDIKKWVGQFIEEPQLPIYCLMFHQKSQIRPNANVTHYSIAYASLKSKEIGMSGILNTGDGTHSVLKSSHPFLKEIETESKKSKLSEFNCFNDLIEYWEVEIGKTCDTFSQGLHAVTPTKTACNYCEFSSICRINDLRSVANDDDESSTAFDTDTHT